MIEESKNDRFQTICPYTKDHVDAWGIKYGVETIL